MLQAHTALLGFCLFLSGASLLAFQIVNPDPPIPISTTPWVDHKTGSPSASTGTIHSEGQFDLGPNYSFFQLKLVLCSQDADRNYEEYVIPAWQVQITGTTGEWNISLPVASGEHNLNGILQIQNKITGQIRTICTNFDEGFVTVP
jgi:hypothetical protein